MGKPKGVLGDCCPSCCAIDDELASSEVIRPASAVPALAANAKSAPVITTSKRIDLLSNDSMYGLTTAHKVCLLHSAGSAAF